MTAGRATITVESFLEFCEGRLIDFEDAEARGKPGAARKAAHIRIFLDDPAWRPVVADLIKSGGTWGNA